MRIQSDNERFCEVTMWLWGYSKDTNRSEDFLGFNGKLWEYCETTMILWRYSEDLMRFWVYREDAMRL